MAVDHNSARSNKGGVKDDGGSGVGIGDDSAKSGAVNHNSSRSNRGSGVKDDGGSGVGIGDGSAKSGAVDHNSTRSNKGTVSGGSSTQGLSTTLGILKTGFTLATVIVLVAAGADLYKMYSDNVDINLEDHVTDAIFQLNEDKSSITGEIGFDVPKMGYFDKSIKVLIHLTIDESDPVTENEFSFEYELGSGEKIYDKFELNDLDPVTKDKIEKEVPLDIEYTTTITILYLGVELAPTTSELGTKVTRMQTA